MTDRYIEAARVLHKLFEEAQAKIDELAPDSGTQYVNQDKINSIWEYAKELEHLEDTVNLVQERMNE